MEIAQPVMNPVQSEPHLTVNLRETRLFIFGKCRMSLADMNKDGILWNVESIRSSK